MWAKDIVKQVFGPDSREIPSVMDQVERLEYHRQQEHF